jgi:hypothetical protein
MQPTNPTTRWLAWLLIASTATTPLATARVGCCASSATAATSASVGMPGDASCCCCAEKSANRTAGQKSALSASATDQQDPVSSCCQRRAVASKVRSTEPADQPRTTETQTTQPRSTPGHCCESNTPQTRDVAGGGCSCHHGEESVPPAVPQRGEDNPLRNLHWLTTALLVSPTTVFDGRDALSHIHGWGPLFDGGPSLQATLCTWRI